MNLLNVVALVMALLAWAIQERGALVLRQASYIERRLRPRYLALVQQAAGMPEDTAVLGWETYLRRWADSFLIGRVWMATTWSVGRLITVAPTLFALVASLYFREAFKLDWDAFTWTLWLIPAVLTALLLLLQLFFEHVTESYLFEGRTRV